MTLVLTRRRFGAALGVLVIEFSLTPRLGLAQPAPAHLPGSLDSNRRLDAWLRIDPDGTVTVFTGKIELGQGILTALAQITAEELDVAMTRLRMISGDTARTPDEGFTSGSQSVEYGGTALRLAAAEARAILIGLAAEKLGTADGLAVADGTITAPNGKQVTYWAITSEAAFRREASAKVAPKPPAEHKLVGRSIPRLDIPAKLTGGASYVQDMRLPGMLFGRVVRPPSYDAELIAIDDAAARGLPGVVAVVRDGRFLGVVAGREEQAIAARAALRNGARWRLEQSLPPRDKLHDYLKSLPSDASTISEKRSAASLAAATLGATYTRPYLAHASIGPSCAIAAIAAGKTTVWTHSQGVFPLRRDLAKALNLPEDAVRTVHVPGSGCYGHNGADDVALDAALLSRAVEGRPVKVQWMRDDEFAWEPYGAAMSMSARAGLSADGRIVEWNYEVWSNTHTTRPGANGVNLLAAWHRAQPLKPAQPEIIPQPAGGGDRNAIPLYDFPNQRVVHHFIPQMPIRVSALRTLGAYANVFAIESFMDELAAAAEQDPVAFRLAHLTDPRARAVISAAAQKAGWREGAKSDGKRGRGIGFAKYKNLATYVAVVAEVEVDRGSGEVRAFKATAVADAGQIVSPDGLANQIEGGIIQSTSWTLKEEVAFDREKVTARDWQSYPILTFPEAPEVDVTLIDQPTERSLGAGEAASGPMAAAIANAVAHATGARLRDLPLSPARVKAALG